MLFLHISDNMDSEGAKNFQWYLRKLDRFTNGSTSNWQEKIAKDDIKEKSKNKTHVL